MKLRVKVSLAIIIGLGIFASAASIIKTVQLKSLSSRDDHTFDTVDLSLWTM
ncbi:MAG: integral membrane [Lasallia pustulata]|uniref:Integral membrane n=1 Tax=Lasallia pustulata TaxID=136370 RepID=A0A5M8PPV1_9LECA|nr:MAG: integral membrane [Lasallia pustulata]